MRQEVFLLVRDAELAPPTRRLADRFQTAQAQGAAEERAKPRRVPVRAGPKVGPNEKCPCGSGKKYKKCCGRLSA